ncbi:tRNA(Met) cytidine acetyltransferase TmcA [Imhoffiella purpurea]|uniref:tRNA(Met) cytidine acetyltransferase TmcA n=1 Tax=Imhoffiella purpurea TaxID=1249627 RepID=W9VBI4_9GAMM|nr:GNAT family N-acetyltransferase [Imhoffiella purpurea]EXJ13397.1 PutativeP-loop ATPase [Imhoffiella purpurea]
MDRIRSLLAEARATNQRRTLILSGSMDWTAKCARALDERAAGLEAAWIADRPIVPQVLPMRSATSLLGRDLELLVFDAHSGFDPDGFGAATGAVRGGGLLVLITPPLDHWPQIPDPQAERIAVWPHAAESVGGRFLARLVRTLREEDGVFRIDQSDGPAIRGDGRRIGTDPLSGPTEGPRGPAGSQPTTPDQAGAVEAVLKTARGRARRPLVMTAHRGRGKSAALGIAAGRLLRDGETRILLTAPRRASVDSVFVHLESVSRDAGRPELGERLRFLSPDAILDERPEADLLLVDEAAGIPTPLLEALLAHYGRIVFSTTVHGYEGTGRGFEIRFRATLDRLTPDWRAIQLNTPIRWAPDDPLERLTLRALLLDAAPAPDAELISASPSNCHFERLDRDTLASDEATLGELFGLLVLAHYQTRPMDLRMLLDGPNVRVLVLRHHGRIAATLLAAEEGGFEDPALREDVFMGRRRPRGHLLPQTLSAHAGLMEAPRYRYLRVIRIAVHPAATRRGLGRMLLRMLHRQAASDGFDLVGSSFGATLDLLRFWNHCGHATLQFGTSRNAASGEHAAVVAEAASGSGDRLIRRAQERLAARLPVLLAGPLRRLDPRLAAALIRTLERPPPEGFEFPPDTREELSGFVSGHRTLEVSLPPLNQLAGRALPSALQRGLVTTEEAALLAAVCLQLRAPQELTRILGASGRNQILIQLRQAAGRLMETAP